MSSEKRPIDDQSDTEPSSEDEGFGPSLAMLQGGEPDGAPAVKPKRKKKHLIQDLSINSDYINSYMHKDQVVAFASLNDILATGSRDGVVKLWLVSKGAEEKKESTDEPQALEFVKEYQTGGSILQLEVNKKTGTMISVNEGEKVLRMFDLKSLDLIDIVELPSEPGLVSFASFERGSKIVWAEKDSHVLHILDYENEQEDRIVTSVHNATVNTLSFNSKYNCMVSSDSKGMIEYWKLDDNLAKPDGVFEMKSKTNLYDLRKSKSWLQNLVLFKQDECFITWSEPDKQLRIFQFQSGKIIKQLPLDIAGNMVIDRSENFLVYANSKGVIQILNLINYEVKSLAFGEDLNFSQVVLLQPPLDKITIEMASSNSNELITKKLDSSRQRNILCAASLDHSRFYVFDNSEDAKTVDKDTRDIYNEVSDGGVQQKKVKYEDLLVTIHTSLGDIQVELFPRQAPLAVENFVRLCGDSYYNNVIFHRIIPKFMIQTGDPTGTGTGGESVYGSHFEDEFSSDLRHFKYYLSMANAGANTNGSQFFIVTSDEQLTHLDDKHTVFGKVISGEEVVDEIEKVRTDSDDRPTEVVPKIISTSVVEL